MVDLVRGEGVCEKSNRSKQGGGGKSLGLCRSAAHTPLLRACEVLLWTGPSAPPLGADGPAEGP